MQYFVYQNNLSAISLANLVSSG